MARSPWIISPLGDIVFLIASPLAILPLVHWLSQACFSAQQISLAVVSFASIGHHLPGFMRAYGDKHLFQRFRWRFLFAPPLTLGIAIGFAWFNYNTLTLALLFWATWHVMMQTYGFMRIYDLKQGTATRYSGWLDFALCTGVFLSGLIFSDARVSAMAELLWQVGCPDFGPHQLALVRAAIGIATGCVAAAYLADMFSRTWRGQPVNWLKLLLICSTGALYWICGDIHEDVLIGVAIFEIFHALQYNAIVWIYNCGSERRQRESMGFLSFLFHDRISLMCLYLAAIAAFGSLRYGVEFMTIPLAQQALRAALVASTMLHFYYDGFIWRVSESRTSGNLGIARPKPRARLSRSFLQVAAIPLAFVLVLAWESYARTHSAETEDTVAKRLHALTPDLPDTQLRAARAAYARGDFNEAASLSQNVVRQRPRSDEAHAELGMAQLRNKQFPAAVNSFACAVALNPTSSENHYWHGTALSAADRPREAIAELMRGTDKRPDRLEGCLALAASYLQLDERMLARRAIDKAIEMEPSSAPARFYSGMYFQKTDQLNEASDAYRACIDRDPEHAAAFGNLGSVLLQQGDLAHAETAYRRAIHLAPKVAENYANLGLLLRHAGRKREADDAILNARQLGYPLSEAP